MTLLSEWGEKVDFTQPCREYPRMHLQRNSYMNLNGVWEYQITERQAKPAEEKWQSVHVPFALGSALSGTQEELQPGQALWYRRQFSYKPNPMHTWINFEAVDMECTVFLNGLEVGTHRGGYTPFSFEISEYIKYQNALMVRCIDDTDYGMYSYGKQKIDHGGMWYTPSSGIWGTVWIEDMPEHAVHDIKITPDYDHDCVHVDLAGDFSQALVTVAVGTKIIHTGITNDKHYTALVPDKHPWTAEDPFLYDLYVQTEDDMVRSYFGMRKFSKEKDSQGIVRFCLNDKPLFLSGLLDQGYSVDGLYTYPDEQAIVDELKTIKDMGFNMLRKHVKIECRRWYYNCDRLGILVMQDMPSGGYDHYDFMTMGLLPTIGFRKMKDIGKKRFSRMSEESEKCYIQELDMMLDALYNYTCIFSWVPFNEGWGQFRAEKITDHIRSYDSTRLIDSASGWHDQGCGDFLSVHDYFFPYHARKDKNDRITFLTEFGGYAYIEAGHCQPAKVYGYKVFKDKLKYRDAVIRLYDRMILKNIPRGLSGCIYTQVSDVEDECNGLFTADRRVVKIDRRTMRKINSKCTGSLKNEG